MEPTIDTLKGIVGDLGIDQDLLNADTLLYADLGLDSVEAVQLSLAVKRRLGIDLKLGTRNDMTLADICNMAKEEPVTSSYSALLSNPNQEIV